MSAVASRSRKSGGTDLGRVRRLGVGGVIAGAAYTALGLVSIGTGITGPVLDGALVVSNVLEILPLVGIYVVYRDVFPRLGLASVAVFVLTTAANIVGTAAFTTGPAGLTFLAFPVGVFGQLLSYLGFAWMTARSDRLPRWTGTLLVLTFPAAIAIGRVTNTTAEFGDYPGALGVGLVYLVVGYLLYRYAPE